MTEDKKKIQMYKDLAARMRCQVFTEENVQKMRRTIEVKDRFTKQYSRGGLYMTRGYYCPSIVEELIVTNVTRGRLLKRLTDRSRPDYCYYFDDGRLVLVQKNFSDEKGFHKYEWIDRQQDTEYSLKVDSDRLFEITISKYEDERIISNAFLWCRSNFETFELILEEYQYNQKGKLTSAVRTMASVYDTRLFEDTYHFDFLYDADGSLVKCILNGDESEDYPVRIPPIVRELITGEPEPARKKALTESAFSRELKKTVKEWKGEDIYAISIFINHDDDEVTDFAVCGNPEEGQKGEERWNYACWDLDEESLMYLLDEKEADWKTLLALCGKAVSKLQEKQFFSKLFGREVPVIIHGYEYALEELEATRQANPGGQADEFFREMKKLGMIE